MSTSALIPIETFCECHQIDIAFIYSLEQVGLAEIILRDETAYIEEIHISDLETYVRLHRELEINPQGIDAIGHLLNQIRMMQDDIQHLKNRLNLYEAE